MAVGAATSVNQAGRRVVFGLNVLLSALLALALVVVLVYLAQRFKSQVDLTSTGSNSLSPRTRQLLNGLNEDVRITGLYALVLKEELQKAAQKRKDTVADLLSLYEALGRGKVTTGMIDSIKEASKRNELLARIRSKPGYADESKPHQEALAAFPALNQQIIQLAENDSKAMKEFFATNDRLRGVREYGIVYNNLAIVNRDATAKAEEIAGLTEGETPRYGRAVDSLREYLTRTRGILQDASNWLGGDAAKVQGLTPELLAFFQGARERYQPVLTAIDEVLKKTENLKEPKLDEAYDTLTRSSELAVIVETKDQARVLALEDVWPFNPDASLSASGDNREFNGEEAISSAILQLTQKEKVGVVFVRFGGESPIKPDFSRVNPMMMELPRAPYQMLDQRLQKANFVTAEWDVSKDKAPPKVEGAGKVIYVVFPPAPPPQPNPMQPQPPAAMTPADRKIVTDAIAQSGMAIFLTGWSQPSSRMSLAGPPYEYADYLKSEWGIEVRYQSLALHFTPSPQNPGTYVIGNNAVLLDVPDDVRLSDHPIGRPLQAASGAFVMAAPLKTVEENKPAGVTVEVLAEAVSNDVWAVSDINKLQTDMREKQGVKPGEGDTRTPFAVAVAATNDKGHKIVVISSERMAADEVAEHRVPVAMTASLQVVYDRPYAANSDFVLNSLHWLSGDAARITAGGPRRGEVPRLDKLKEGPAATFWRVFLVGIWPAIALLAGGAVWLMRRR